MCILGTLLFFSLYILGWPKIVYHFSITNQQQVFEIDDLDGIHLKTDGTTISAKSRFEPIWTLCREWEIELGIIEHRIWST